MRKIAGTNIHFQYIDRHTGRELADKKFYECNAPAIEHIVDQFSQLCCDVTLKPPKHLTQQLTQFQARVILNISIDFASCFEGIERTEYKE